MKRPYIVHVIVLMMVITVSIISCNKTNDPNMDRILVITGGHDFEPSLYDMFDSFETVQYDTIIQPNFNKMISKQIPDQYLALVFYDMYQEITEDQQKAFLSMLEKGQGIVFLHHALVSYQHWDEFINIVGGRYIETNFYDDPNMKGSTYKHDITLDIKVADNSHPVTKGILDFSIFDEGYQYIEMTTGIKPLLTTNHPDCTPTVGWTNHYKNSRIVYLLPGHGPEAHQNENYRKLVRNAIGWVGEKTLE